MISFYQGRQSGERHMRSVTLITNEVQRRNEIKCGPQTRCFHFCRQRCEAWFCQRSNYLRQSQFPGGAVSFDFAQNCRQLCRFVSNRTKAQPLERCTVETSHTEAMKTGRMTATGNHRCSGPKSFRMFDRSMKLNRIGPGKYFIKNRDGSVRKLIARAFCLATAN